VSPAKSGGNRRAILLLAGGLAAIAVLRFTMGGDPAPAVVPASDSAPLAERRLDLLRRKAATLSAEEALLKQATVELRGREKGIIEAPTAQQAQAQLVEIIHKVANANGFDVKGVESMPQPKLLGNDYAVVSVTETFSCGIDQLVNFLASLGNEPQLLSTDEVQVTGGSDKKKNIQVRLSLSGVVPRRLAPEKKGGPAF
jgi:hypothetical protein